MLILYYNYAYISYHMINGHSNVLTAFIKPRDDYLSSIQRYFTFAYTEMPILSVVPFLTSTSIEERNFEKFSSIDQMLLRSKFMMICNLLYAI